MSDINGSKPTNFPLDESKLDFKIPRTDAPRENVLKLGSMITNRIGLKATADDPEYWGLAGVMTDEMVDVALKMGVRKPKTTEQLMKLTKMEREPLEKLLTEMAWTGIIEYNWENLNGKNPKHEKRWVLPLFVPGSAEFLNMRKSQIDEHPEVAAFFERMTMLPLEKITPMVPPGGAGIGMHVIPVEKAIETENESVDLEHISYWLSKYEGKYAKSMCSCRLSRAKLGEGCGDDAESWCIGVGDMADYIVETQRGEYITKDEALEIFKKAEDNGFVHQITNIDGEQKIFGICNCNVNVCNALRTSQLFNTPNLSRSAYVASVESEKCVACGRCEDACTRGTVDQAVAIDEVKRFIAQQDLNAETRFVPEKVIPKVDGEFSEKIAVIGGGPAGLSCAYYLAEKGYRPTVFEREARPGGMLMNGIPSFRLEKDVVEAEIDILRELGVEFRCGVEVGKDVTIAQLREQGYQGFYVAVGLQSGGKLNIPGGDADGVMAGIDFMRQVNLHEKKTLSGKVVVIGGGNIGADVARTAVRCGAESVDLYCLEAYDDMPMGEEDRSECERDGITVHAGWGQTEIVVEDGKCAGIRFRKCTRVKNGEGRFAPEFDDSVSEQAECTTVLYCIGQKVDWRELLTGTAVEFNPNGTVKADPVTYQTAEKDIFVGGDAYTGQKFAIDAIAAGKEGAISLHRFVQHATLTVGRNRRQFIELDKENALIPVNYDTTPRQRIGYNEALRRTFSDERVAFTEEQIKKETARCLSCGASIVDPNKCIGCGVCTTKCAFDAIHLHRERPECSKMYACEDKMKAILPYMIKREFKIKRAARKSK
jgi:pyridine nucleotide-disulphide oxidoreductase family protein